MGRPYRRAPRRQAQASSRSSNTDGHGRQSRLPKQKSQRIIFMSSLENRVLATSTHVSFWIRDHATS
jgi:hypothetical protein